MKYQEVSIEDVFCKFCGGKNLVKNGTRKQVQRFLCRDCRRTFNNNKALPGMRTPTDQIGCALSAFYEGSSLNAICRQMKQTYNYCPSDSTVYKWVVRFTKAALSEANNYQAEAGTIWIADETVLKIGGKNIWFWDLIDDRTRFLLASHFSKTRTIKDANTLMTQSLDNATNVPKIIITDKLRAYLDGIELAFGADAKHLQSEGFEAEINTNLIERFHGTLKARTKIMRGMKKIETAKLFMGGWLIHYNFFRPHQSLDGKTPGEVAKVDFPFKSWTDIVKGGRNA